MRNLGMFRIACLHILILCLAACGVAEPMGVDDDDARVIAALKDAGSDLTKPHPIDFYFVEFPDRVSADRFAQSLRDTGWKFDVHQSPDSSDWTVIASTVMVPDAYEISLTSAKLRKIAPQYGGDYDGWEAAVTP